MTKKFDIVWHNSATKISDDLWNACFPEPLEGKWWYVALEQSGLEDQFTFLYAVILLEGQPAAIAPAFVMNVPMSQVVPQEFLPLFNILGKVIPTLLFQRTFFIGSPCSDEGTVGILPEIDRYALLRYANQEILNKAKQYHASMFAWKDFPNSYKKELLEISKEQNLFPIVSFPGTTVNISAPDKDSYFASLKTTYRHLLKKKIKRSISNVDIKVEILQHPDPAILDQIFNLFWQTYEKSSTKFEKLTREFFTKIASCPVAHFIILRERLSGGIIAFMLCFTLKDHIINKFIGLDYTRPKEWYLYFRLWDELINWAITRKASVIQSGQTGYAPKFEMGHNLIPLTHYCRNSNPVIHMIYKIFSKKITWATLDKNLAVYIKAHPEILKKMC